MFTAGLVLNYDKKFSNEFVITLIIRICKNDKM